MCQALPVAAAAAIVWTGTPWVPASSASRTPRPTSPSAYLTRVVRLLVENRYGDAWTTLNPLDKAVAGRSLYVACENSRRITTQLLSIHVIETRADRVVVAPEHAARAAVEVTFRLDLTSPVTGRFDLVIRRHALAEHGNWTWMLSRQRYLEYAHHECGRQPSA